MKKQSSLQTRVFMLATVVLSVFLFPGVKAQSAIGQLEHLTGTHIDRGNSSSSYYNYNYNYNSNHTNSFSASYYRRLEDASTFNERAIRYMNSGDYKKAVSVLRKARWYDPFNTTVKTNLAKAKRALRDERENRNYYVSTKPARVKHISSVSTQRPNLGSSAATNSGSSGTSNGTVTSNPSNSLTITTLDGRTRALTLNYDYYRNMTYMTPNKGIENNAPARWNLEDSREFKIAEKLVSKVGEYSEGKLPAAIGSFMLNVTSNTFSALQDATDALTSGTVTSEDIHNLNVRVIINKSLMDMAESHAEDMAQSPIEESGIGYLDEKFGKISKTFSKIGIGAVGDAKDLYEIYKAPSLRDGQH